MDVKDVLSASSLPPDSQVTRLIENCPSISSKIVHLFLIENGGADAGGADAGRGAADADHLPLAVDHYSSFLVRTLDATAFVLVQNLDETAEFTQLPRRWC